MKKNWLNPELKDLEITETAGGKYKTAEADSDAWLDPTDNKWKEYLGTDMS